MTRSRSPLVRMIPASHERTRDSQQVPVKVVTLDGRWGWGGAFGLSLRSSGWL